MVDKQEVNSAVVVFSGLVSVLILLVAVVGVHAWYLNVEASEMDTKWEMSPNTALADLRKGQMDRMGGSVRWMNKDHGRVAIPIEDAMTMFVAQNGKMPTTVPAAVVSNPAPATKPAN